MHISFLMVSRKPSDLRLMVVLSENEARLSRLVSLSLLIGPALDSRLDLGAELELSEDELCSTTVGSMLGVTTTYVCDNATDDGVGGIVDASFLTSSPFTSR